jgi:hypothetical protein
MLPPREEPLDRRRCEVPSGTGVCESASQFQRVSGELRMPLEPDHDKGVPVHGKQFAFDVGGQRRGEVLRKSWIAELLVQRAPGAAPAALGAFRRTLSQA